MEGITAMADSDQHHDEHHEDDVPTQASRPGLGSSDLLRKAFDRAAGPDTGDGPAPERIGNFRVLGRVGRGGMGSVYKATDEREGSAGRVVAIKLIRKGLDTEDVLRRFKLEGQLLSALNHPNIARLHEVAETDDGQPYFVMEYVEGKPIDVYCDRERVPIAKRLEIFRKVCAAVHHAHTNLIVHRDLKPGNILVTPEGEPKLLDFGIAKLLNPALGRVEVLTRPTMRIMTPEYASPEQVRGDAVSTSSDVYSLGVLLYELLCGRRPYHFAKRIEAEVVRVICESEPLRPSTAITSVEETQSAGEQPATASTITPASIAQSRSAERVESLRRSLTGDLDDIVMMAMSKESNRRYSSAEHLSMDLQRYLDGMPVEARRTGARRIYLFKKFLKRHRTEVAAAAIVALALLTTGTATSLQWRAASIADAQAAEAARAEALALEEALAVQRDLTISSAFGDALWDRANADLTFTMSPAERDEFWNKLRVDFQKLVEKFGEENPQVKRARGRALLQAGSAMSNIRSGNTGDFESALAAYKSARDDFVVLRALYPDDYTIWYQTVEAHLRVSDSYKVANQPGRAIAECERAVEVAEDSEFPDMGLRFYRQRGKAYFSLAQLASAVGDAPRATEAFEKEIASRRERRDASPNMFVPARDMGIVLLSAADLEIEKGNIERAREMVQEALDIRRALSQDPQWEAYRTSVLRDLSIALVAMAIIDTHQGQSREAREQVEESITLLDGLAELEPENIRPHRTAAFLLVEYGEASRVNDDIVTTRWAMERCAGYIERLESLSPSHPSLVYLRAHQRRLTAQIDLAEGRKDRAVEGFTIARDQLASLLQLDENSVTTRRMLGDTLVGLAQSRRPDGVETLPASARAAFVEARKMYELCPPAGEPFGPRPESWALVEQYAPGE